MVLVPMIKMMGHRLDEKIAGLQERIDGQAAATNEINDRFEAQVVRVVRSTSFPPCCTSLHGTIKSC